MWPNPEHNGHSALVFSVGKWNHKYCKSMNYLCNFCVYTFRILLSKIAVTVRRHFDSALHLVGPVDSTSSIFYSRLKTDKICWRLLRYSSNPSTLWIFCGIPRLFSRRPGRAQPWQWGRGWGRGCGPDPPAQSPPAPQRRKRRPFAPDAWDENHKE